MTAEAYNKKRIDSGKIKLSVVTEAFRSLQRDLGEDDDGYWGSVSQGAYDLRRDPAEVPDLWAREIVKVAEAELGRGELIADNAGEDVHRYRDFPFGEDYARPIGNWCAFFAGYVIEQAAANIGRPLPKWRRFYDEDRNRRMPIGSARKLAIRAAEAGEYVAENGVLLQRPTAGDIFAIKRPRRGAAAGHVGIITRYLGGERCETIEGNATRFPCEVERLTRDFASLDLETIARL